MTQKDFAAQYTKIRLVKEIVFQCLTDPDKWRVVYPVGTEFYTMEAGNAFTSLAKNAGEPYMREPTHLTSKLGAILCASPDEYEIVTNGA